MSRHPSESSIPLAPTHQEAQRDEEFYFHDLVFLVDGHLFKVPRYPFEDGSEVFRDMLAIPTPPGSPVDGCNDQYPLRLESVSAGDFRQLLRVMFPRSNSTNGPQTIESWTSVLRLASMWGFASIRADALHSLNSLDLDATERIVLARDHDIPAWRMPALVELVERSEPMGMHEFERLGAECVLKIGRIREHALRERATSAGRVPAANFIGLARHSGRCCQCLSPQREILLNSPTTEYCRNCRLPILNIVVPGADLESRIRAEFDTWDFD